MKAVLEMEMYRRGGSCWVGVGHGGPHRRPGQCQGARTEVIRIGLSGDKTATPPPPSHLLHCLCRRLSGSLQAPAANWRTGGCEGRLAVFYINLVEVGGDGQRNLPGVGEKGIGLLTTPKAWLAKPVLLMAHHA